MHPPSVFPTRLFWLGALVGLVSGCCLGWLHIASMKVVMPILLSRAHWAREHWDVLNLAFRIGPVAGIPVAFALSRIPRLRVQVVMFLGLWVYAFLMVLIWFRNFEGQTWAAWVGLAASLSAQGMLSCGFVLLPLWFGSVGESSRVPVLALAACPYLGMVLGVGTYFLYLERWLSLAEQVRVTTWLLAGTAFAAMFCAARCVQNLAPEEERPRSDAPTFGHYVMWVLLAFAAEGLSHATVTHISVDISPVPLLREVVLLFSRMAVALAFLQPRPQPDGSYVVVGCGIRMLAVLALAPYLYAILQTASELGRESGPLLLLALACLMLLIIPYVATFWLQLLLLAPALWFLFSPPFTLSLVWSLFLLFAVLWVNVRGCYGRISELAPGADHLPHVFLCMLAGIGLAWLNAYLYRETQAVSWLVEYVLFLVIAVGLRLVPCAKLKEGRLEGQQ